MLKFETNGKHGTISMTLPTELSEITPGYLKAVTNNVVIANHYSLIGLLYKESLSGIIIANNNKQKQITTKVIPIFIKSGSTDIDYINNISCGSTIIISPSDMVLGHHVTCPKNKISINNIISYFDGDKEAYRKAMGLSQPCYYLEFKLVPNCVIHGNYIEDVTSFENPFVEFKKGVEVEGVV